MFASRSQSLPAGAPVDLTNCDREPIHTPGSIQPHGALFALDPATFRILAASENCEAFTGVALDRTVNALCEDVFGRDVLERLQDALADPVTIRGSATFPATPAYRARVHSAAETLYLELEPESLAVEAVDAELRDAPKRFDAEREIVPLCDEAARSVRGMTGYDRVMIYRFDSDGHGSVIAEAREPKLDAFLGQHYPASDIPRQARELYRTTMLRLIVDVSYAPSPLVPNEDPRNGAPWDLGRAILRSVSPIHIQYLKNMGVTATLTISLLRDGELWGLIACHHYSPKYAGHDVRAGAEALGYALVARIAALEDRKLIGQRDAVRSAIAAFTAEAGEDRALAVATSEPLHRVLGWDGAAAARGKIVARGSAPSEAHIEALAAWLDERRGADRFITDNLAKLNPTLRDIAPVASGVFAYRLPGGWLFGFRAEFKHEIVWGGDPNKSAALGDNDRLTPRGSFEKWREEVNERAVPWEPAVLEGLEEIVRFVEGAAWS